MKRWMEQDHFANLEVPIFPSIVRRLSSVTVRSRNAPSRACSAAMKRSPSVMAAARIRQLNLMNSRVIALVAGSEDRWALAGDQFFVDLDLAKENLPAGTRLAMGSAIVEVTAVPHLGCKKFVARFGMEAMKFVNSRRGKKLCLRGINAKVVQSGRVSTGDTIRRV